MMNTRATITFEGRNYYFDTVESYFDNDICREIDFDSDEPQRIFEQYIEADPSFVELFEHDFYSID